MIQAYNYGGGFLDYVASHGGKYSFELAQAFAEEKSGGVRVTYKNEISVAENGGWRYDYGNMFYVRLVSEYLYAAQFDSETVNAIMNEALKYQGWEYVYGGASPTTSFDCSGLTQWCYGGGYHLAAHRTDAVRRDPAYPVRGRPARRSGVLSGDV